MANRLTTAWKALTAPTTPTTLTTGQIQQATSMSVGDGRPMGPSMPLTPMEGYRPTGGPRQFDYRVGTNIRSRADRDGRISFETLKGIIDAYDVAQMCITHRIDDIRSLDWTIVPKRGINAEMTDITAMAYTAMDSPDGVNDFASWLAMYLEDVLRYDAGALYRRKNRGGAVCALEVIDGTTIGPIIDYYGRRPTGDAPAYTQFIQGQPFTQFTAADIIYQPFRPSTNSPYGRPPIESILLAANTDLRFQQHFLRTFTEGTVPYGFAMAPEGLDDPDKIAQWQEVWDALLQGDEAAKHQIKWMPQGTTFEWPSEEGFDSTFSEFLMMKTCAAYHVTPSDLGFTQDVNKATSVVQKDIQFRIGTTPLVQHCQRIFTRYLQRDLGFPVEFQFDLGADDEDALQSAQVDGIMIDHGVISPDEVRGRRYGLPIDDARPTPRYIMTTHAGPVPLVSLYDVAGPIDPETGAPDEDAPLQVAEFAGADGVSPYKAPGGQQFTRAPLNPDDPLRPQLEHAVPGSGVVAPPAPAGSPPAVVKALGQTVGAPTVAGLVVRADDTGRILMIQRALTPEDPCGGMWEFPGGHLEPTDPDLISAATREWSEETGSVLPPGTFGATWTSPDGIYAGFVYNIPSEAALAINCESGRVLNPDDPDGDSAETVAWFDPADLPAMPSLRPAVLATPWDAITGLSMIDGPEVRKELRQWRTNARSRIDRGQAPKAFNTDVIPDQLWLPIAKALTVATDRAGVDAAFVTAIRPKGDAVTKSWRDQPAVTAPQHQADLALTDYWAPRVTAALLALFTAADLTAAIVAAKTVHDGAAPVRKDDTGDGEGGDEVGNAVRAKVRSVLGTRMTQTDLEQVIRQAWIDAYITGGQASTQAMTAGGLTITTPAATTPGINWADWKPGNPDAAVLADNGGWRAALAAANIDLAGIVDTTLDRVANAIVNGLQAGSTIDDIGGGLADVIGDPGRAEMIAHTETARMLTASSLNNYAANGITQWDWVISAGACPVCINGEARSPYPTGEAGLIPAHPRCRCAAAPHVSDE